MKPSILVPILAIGVGAIAYQQIAHQAEREQWRAESSRLNGRLQEAERVLHERKQLASTTGIDDRRRTEAAAALAKLEVRILDAAAELAMLESDRTVAESRAETALDDLKSQVRSLTTIEMDMAVLDRQRLRLQGRVATVEERLQEAETGAAERQKRAETLDRDIAGLAIRREALLASLDAARMTAAAEEAGASDELAAAKTPADAAATPAGAEPVRKVESADVGNEDRTLGLYQFSSLSATPESEGLGKGGLPPSSKKADKPDEADPIKWAEDQYLLGLTLLTTAERSSGTRELSEAVLAFKAALGEWPQQRNAMRWAITRSDLGYALALLGKRQGDVDLLEQAAASCRDALGTFNQNETPVLWAGAQHHLGVSLDGLADLRGDLNLRQASVQALERAIAEFKNAGADGDARKAEVRLRDVTAKLEAETKAAAE